MTNSARSPTIDKRQAHAVAGNGLLDRRMLLGHGIAFAGATGAGAGFSAMSGAAEPFADAPWSLAPGGSIRLAM
jgi:sulfane dehydrogenase subunit SoxC